MQQGVDGGLLDQHTVDDMLTWQGTGGFSLDADPVPELAFDQTRGA